MFKDSEKSLGKVFELFPGIFRISGAARGKRKAAQDDGFACGKIDDADLQGFRPLRKGESAGDENGRDLQRFDGQNIGLGIRAFDLCIRQIFTIEEKLIGTGVQPGVGAEGDASGGEIAPPAAVFAVLEETVAAVKGEREGIERAQKRLCVRVQIKGTAVRLQEQILCRKGDPSGSVSWWLFFWSQANSCLGCS